MKSRQGPGGHLCSKVETLDPEKDLSAQSLETDNDHSWNGAKKVKLQGGDNNCQWVLDPNGKSESDNTCGEKKGIPKLL